MSRRRELSAVLDRPDEMNSAQPAEVPPSPGRSDRRFIVNQPVRISIPGSVRPPYEARLRDISRRGMQFVVDRPFEGPCAKVEWNGREIYGTVRYQHHDGDEYRLGLELPSSWESLVSDVLAQQALELELSNSALQQQAEVLRQADERLVAYSNALAKQNEELCHALDAARQASAAKSRFLGSVSHELRTPLNGIVGFAQLFHDGALGPISELQRECVGDMLSCSGQLLMLIGDLLDLTKIESGKMTFQFEPVSLTRLITEAAETMQAIADSKRIEISLRHDAQVDTVLADAGRLKQILYNYLSNALKFTGTGGRIRMCVAAEDRGFYRMEVEDDGIGIAPGDIPRLFSEFSQLGSSEQSKAGSGLGLAVSKRIAEALGGRVGVESEFGKGSRFYVVLPRDPRAGARVETKPE
jgi:signal transduction histidine kinase